MQSTVPVSTLLRKTRDFSPNCRQTAVRCFSRILFRKSRASLCFRGFLQKGRTSGIRCFAGTLSGVLSAVCDVFTQTSVCLYRNFNVDNFCFGNCPYFLATQITDRGGERCPQGWRAMTLGVASAVPSQNRPERASGFWWIM